MTLDKNDKANYLLCLREFTEADTYTYTLPLAISRNHKLITLYGNGTVTANGNKLTVTVKEQPGYMFIKIDQGAEGDAAYRTP